MASSALGSPTAPALVHRFRQSPSAAAGGFVVSFFAALFSLSPSTESDRGERAANRRPGAAAAFGATTTAAAMPPKRSIPFVLPTTRVAATFCEEKTPSRTNLATPDLTALPQTPNDSGEGKQASTAPSKLRYLLHSLRLSPLPTPRLLTPRDPAFAYPSLLRGLRRRKKDEERLRSIQREAVEARNSGDPEAIKRVFEKISEVAYGRGVSPQMREDFVAEYGCTGHTPQILSYLSMLASDRGIVEIGAGNGQWARALNDCHATSAVTSPGEGRAVDPRIRENRKHFEFVLPYDDMSDLPLSTEVYHRHTQPAADYFHPNVRRCSPGAADVLKRFETRGRVLLLVYPPPGPMALDTIEAYVDVYEGNDTVVYVGEGRGGANGNDELFDYFLEGGWVLLHVMDVRPCPGGKGYEKMFVLKRQAQQ